MPPQMWEGIPFDLSYTQPTYSAPYHHIELRASEPLPVTETGYRSHFIHPDELSFWPTVEAFVNEWLTLASKSPHWKAYRAQSRQLSLF